MFFLRFLLEEFCSQTFGTKDFSHQLGVDFTFAGVHFQNFVYIHEIITFSNQELNHKSCIIIDFKNDFFLSNYSVQKRNPFAELLNKLTFYVHFEILSHCQG